MKVRKLFLGLAAVILTLPAFAQSVQSEDMAKLVSTKSIDWKKFLAQHDMYWDEIKPNYFAGAFMGNGMLGTNFYKNSDNNYRLDVGRTDVTEDRNLIEIYKSENHIYHSARLPIGYFQLKTQGAVNAENMRLSIYDATTTGKLTTDKGEINFKTYVHANKDCIVFESDALNDEVNYTWSFVGYTAIAPRSLMNIRDKPEQVNYNANPNPALKFRADGDYQLRIQNLVCGKTYVVAWKEVKTGTHRRIIATVSQEKSEEQAIAVAKQTIDDGFKTDQTALETEHKKWWHNYYPASFISFGNTKIESFYWAQVYRVACSTRQNGMIIDNLGAWPLTPYPWGSIWMNLNIQLTYSWPYAANRSELSEPVWKAFRDYKGNLVRNVTDVPGQESWTDAIIMARSAPHNLYCPVDPAKTQQINLYETGNMTWLLFYYWQYCVYNNKEDELKTEFFDLLKRSINYYFHIRYTGTDGKYHLPSTGSPEYNKEEIGNDVNYDLSLLRWGLQTLLDINSKYSLGDAKQSDWQDFLSKLTPYPENENGYKVSATTGFDKPHRHFSHLMMIYLHLVNWENPFEREIITKSLNRWQSFDVGFVGYSLSIAASMYAGMGDGNTALTRLDSLLAKHIQENSFYKEGNSGPVFETPIAAATALQEMYLQSWGNKIRIFPAVPTDWKQGSFIDLRTEGAFLISAARDNGKTVFIQVKSEAGGLCRLQTGMDLNTISVQTLAGQTVNYTITDAANGLIEMNTTQGDVIQLFDTTVAITHPTPLIHPDSETMPYGVRKSGK
jgi:hypothetical protein